MNSTDEAILTFAEAFSRLGDRKYRDLYVEALASIVRMAKAEERYAAQTEDRPAPQAETKPAVHQVSNAPLVEPPVSIAPAVVEGMQRSLSRLLTDDLSASPETEVQSITKRG